MISSSFFEPTIRHGLGHSATLQVATLEVLILDISLGQLRESHRVCLRCQLFFSKVVLQTSQVIVELAMSQGLVASSKYLNSGASGHNCQDPWRQRTRQAMKTILKGIAIGSPAEVADVATKQFQDRSLHINYIDSGDTFDPFWTMPNLTRDKPPVDPGHICASTCSRTRS